MNKLFAVLMRIVISLIFSSLVLAGAMAAFQFLDPTFSMGMFHMLALRSLPAWLLLGLTTAIGYALLTWVVLRRRDGTRSGLADKQSD